MTAPPQGQQVTVQGLRRAELKIVPGDAHATAYGQPDTQTEPTGRPLAPHQIAGRDQQQGGERDQDDRAGHRGVAQRGNPADKVQGQAQAGCQHQSRSVAADGVAVSPAQGQQDQAGETEPGGGHQHARHLGDELNQRRGGRDRYHPDAQQDESAGRRVEKMHG